MKPSEFPEANVTIRPPEGMSDGQCASIAGRVAQMVGGQLDGIEIITVAWQPDAQDIERIRNGGLIYLNFVSGVVPHSLSTTLLPCG